METYNNTSGPENYKKQSKSNTYYLFCLQI